MAGKIWFITGASRGFGREWAVAALDRGDKVAATARDLDTLTDLVQKYGDAVLPIHLDVTDREADIAAVAQAKQHFGRLDVVVNNAGYGQFGFIEELSEKDARYQFEVNVFGVLWVTQAAITVFREQGFGHLLQVTSMGGLVASGPLLGIYHSSKWAVEAFSEAAAGETKEFGVKVTMIEPGAFGTDWSGPSSMHAEALPAYARQRGIAEERWANPPVAAGDPSATSVAVLAVVDSDDPPLRLLLGARPLPIIKADYESRIAEWDKWNDVSVAAQG
ncbi:MAG: short-chain alcohol dehydrogenase [Microbacteriaceae bacterium]|nr:short-chain alcohol dehydrogenase [Microbacteriaceae bacterium]